MTTYRKGIMVTIKLLLSFLSVSTFYTSFPIHEPNKEIIYELFSDLDEVLIQQPCVVPLLILTGIAHNPLNAVHYLYYLWKVDKAYARDSSGLKEALYDRDGNAIEGITFHFLHHGMKNPGLACYIPLLIKTMEENRCFIKKTREIYVSLKKEKKCIIHYATNKDRISYDITAARFGDTFTTLPSKVFVAHPGNSTTCLSDIAAFAQQPTTSDNYKELVHKTINIEESGNIIHTIGRKPEQEYYEHMLSKSDSTNSIKIFVDDKKINVDGFMALQKNTTHRLYGIHFQNPQQLAQDLVIIGALSQEAYHTMFAQHDIKE